MLQYKYYLNTHITCNKLTTCNMYNMSALEQWAIKQAVSFLIMLQKRPQRTNQCPSCFFEHGKQKNMKRMGECCEKLLFLISRSSHFVFFFYGHSCGPQEIPQIFSEIKEKNYHNSELLTNLFTKITLKKLKLCKIIIPLKCQISALKR